MPDNEEVTGGVISRIFLRFSNVYWHCSDCFDLGTECVDGVDVAVLVVEVDFDWVAHVCFVCVCFLLTQPSYNPSVRMYTFIFNIFEPVFMRLKRELVLPQLAPLAQIALRRSEESLRVQEASAGVAAVLLIVVHLATPARSHALGNLVIRNAGLTAGNCNGLCHHRLSKSSSQFCGRVLGHVRHGGFYFPFFFALRCTLYAIATACFCGFPALISALMFLVKQF